ncbi:hypothetical protein SALBM135S_00983 [Streptomyces alboniger]
MNTSVMPRLRKVVTVSSTVSARSTGVCHRNAAPIRKRPSPFRARPGLLSVSLSLSLLSSTGRAVGLSLMNIRPTREMPKLPASMATAAVGPKNPATTPARAGPAMYAIAFVASSRPFAATICSLSTRFDTAVT